MTTIKQMFQSSVPLVICLGLLLSHRAIGQDVSIVDLEWNQYVNGTPGASAYKAGDILNEDYSVNFIKANPFILRVVTASIKYLDEDNVSLGEDPQMLALSFNKTKGTLAANLTLSGAILNARTGGVTCKVEIYYLDANFNKVIMDEVLFCWSKTE